MWRQYRVLTLPSGLLGAVALQQVPDIGPTYDLIDRGGVVATLLVVIAFLAIALIRGWIVTGAHYKDVKESEEKLRSIVEGTTKGLEAIRDEMREQRLERAAHGRRGS